MTNAFVPIASLPDIPSFPAIGNYFAVQAAGVTYRVNARLLPMVSDSLVTWGAQPVDLPGSRQLSVGLGLSLSLATPGQAILSWSGSGVIPDGDKGDIVVSGLGTIWTIDTQSVTYAKMQNISATQRILGRFTAGAGVTEEITPTQLTTMINVFTNLLSGAVPASAGGTVNFLRADGTFAVPPGTGLPDGDKGDITVSAGGTVWTIDNTTITYAKMQNVSATSRFLGRITAGAGVVEEMTVNQVKGLLNAVVTNATVTGSFAIDLSLGEAWNLTMTGNTTFTFTNPPASGVLKNFTIVIRQDGTGSRIATWPTVKWSLGTIPVLSTGPNKYDALNLFTMDGGTIYFGGQILADAA